MKKAVLIVLLLFLSLGAVIWFVSVHALSNKPYVVLSQADQQKAEEQVQKKEMEKPIKQLDTTYKQIVDKENELQSALNNYELTLQKNINDSKVDDLNKQNQNMAEIVVDLKQLNDLTNKDKGLRNELKTEYKKSTPNADMLSHLEKLLSTDLSQRKKLLDDSLAKTILK